MRNEFKLLVVKPEKMRTLGRSRRRLEYDIDIDV